MNLLHNDLKNFNIFMFQRSNDLLEVYVLQTTGVVVFIENKKHRKSIANESFNS